MPDIASTQAAEQCAPVQRPRAEIRDRRPLRQRERVGADQPDQIGQRQHDDHQQRKQRIERHQHAPSARGRERKSGDQQQQPDRGRGRQQQQAGFDRPGEPGVAPVLADQLPGMQQQQRPERTRQHQRAELDAGRTECHDRHRQQHRKHRLLSADNGARQQIQRPERRDGAKLRQQIDAEHVIAGGAKRDVGEPERQRRAEIGSDLVFPAKGQHGREVAGRAAIEQQRQEQPQRRLEQHHEPDHQPRPGADQFDNREVKRMKRPKCPRRARPLVRQDVLDRDAHDAARQATMLRTDRSDVIKRAAAEATAVRSRREISAAIASRP